MLKARIYTALALLAGFLITLFALPEPAPAVVFGLLVGILGWEWSGMMRVERGGRLLYAGVLMASCYAVYSDPEFLVIKLWVVAAVFWLFVAPLWLWRGWAMAANDMAGYLTGWILTVPTWAAMLALQDGHPWWLFGVMGVVWIADISAYFAGRRWGRHKLAPSISPGKTWEGVFGAMVGVGIYSLIACWVAGISLADKLGWIPVLVALVAVSVMGDLFESMVKRQAGVKDSSQLLPGHGGFFDRLDSQTSMLPLAALALMGGIA